MKHEEASHDTDMDDYEVDDDKAEDNSESNMPRPMKEDEVVAFCLEEISKGIGGSQSSTGDINRITVADDYYFGRRPGLPPSTARDPKASRYVSLDVQDAVEATTAEILPMFMTEELAYYVPDSVEDEEKAKAESDLVNYMFFHESDGHQILQSCLRNALLKANCTAKVHWDERTVVSYETYANVTAMTLPELLTPESDDETIEVITQESEIITEQVPDPLGIKESVSHETEVFEIQIKRMKLVGKPVIESVKPSRVIVSGDHDTPVLNNVIFCAHQNVVTQSELIAQGFPAELVDSLDDFHHDITDKTNSTTQTEFDYNPSDRSVRYIETYECYTLLDVDGDGIAERRKIVISGSTMLSDDPWDSVALIGGTTTAIPQRYKGLSLFEKIRDIQDSKTPIIRSIIDGTQLSSNPRIGVITGKANIDDIITSKTGGIVRAERPDAVFAIPNPEVPQSSYTMLDFMDNQRRERGGSAIGAANEAQKVQSDTAHAFERTMSAIELSNALLARTFAETLIKGIYVQFHQIVRENYKGELSAQIGGSWVKSTPSDWVERTAVIVSVGASNAERQRQSNAMSEIIGYQNQLKQEGSIMYSEKKEYSAIVKKVGLAGVKNPEAYFTDPSSDEGQAASKAKGEQAQQQTQEQQVLQQAMAKAQTDIGEAERMKSEASVMGQKIKAENESLKNQISAMKTKLDDKNKSIDQQLKIREQNMKEEQDDSANAIALTKIEVEANRDVSQQNEDNKTE